MNGELDRLTALAYSAALDDTRWEAFLQASSALFGGGIRTCLFGYDADSHVDLGARQFGYDPCFEQSYADYYAEKDFVAAKLLEQQAGRVVPYEEMWNKDGWQRTEFYNEWVRPQENITGGCSVLLFNQERRLFSFSGSIRAKDAPRLEKPWQHFVNHMTPHLQQAFEIARTLASAELEKQGLVDIHDPVTAACLLVAQDRTVLFTNAQAEDMLEKGSVIRYSFKRRLTFPDIRWEKDFIEALVKLHSSGKSQPQTLLLTDQCGRPVLTCRLAPLYPDKLDYQPTGILFDSGEPCFLLTLSEPKKTEDFPSRLREQFKLTPTETEVLLCLTEGASTREIAEERATSVNTVRNQVQSILNKMGMSRQTDVVRTVGLMRNSNVG